MLSRGSSRRLRVLPESRSEFWEFVSEPCRQQFSVDRDVQRRDHYLICSWCACHDVYEAQGPVCAIEGTPVAGLGETSLPVARTVTMTMTQLRVDV